MTPATMTDFEKLCTWKAERRYNDLHLKLLGIELVRMDCAEFRLNETAAWVKDALARIAAG